MVMTLDEESSHGLGRGFGILSHVGEGILSIGGSFSPCMVHSPHAVFILPHACTLLGNSFSPVLYLWMWLLLGLASSLQLLRYSEDLRRLGKLVGHIYVFWLGLDFI
jgi:hypothetical protein